MRTYQTKIIKAGNLTACKTYSSSLYRGYEVKRDTVSKRKDGEKRDTNIYRTQNALMFLINANITTYSKFITLTTDEPIYNREEFIKKFQLFNLRFKRRYGFKLPYVAVLERQYKRQEKFNLPEAPLHIHLIGFLDFYLPFKELKALWGQSTDSVDVKVIDSTENVGLYLMKYITKELVALNKKGYLSSQKLKQPEEVALPQALTLKEKSFSSSYIVNTNWRENSSHLVSVSYEEFKGEPEFIDTFSGSVLTFDDIKRLDLERELQENENLKWSLKMKLNQNKERIARYERKYL